MSAMCYLTILFGHNHDTQIREDFLRYGDRDEWLHYLVGANPLYISETTCVFEAKDSHNQQNVALKVMRDKEQFEKELVLRERVYECKGDVDAVIDIQEAIILCNDNDTFETGEEFCNRLQRDLKIQGKRIYTAPLAPRLGHFEAGHYVLVMPLAERDLATMMSQERFAGCDLEEIRAYGKDIAECLNKLHKCGIIHGNTCVELLHSTQCGCR